MSKVRKSYKNADKVRKKVNELKDKNEILKELKALEETRQKAVSEKDRLLKKLEKLNKGKIPYDGEGGFFKKGKLIFKKQVEGIWSRSKEADYRRKVMLLLNFEFGKDRENLRKALEDNKMRWNLRISKMVELFCEKYDVLPSDLFRIQSLSFDKSGNIMSEQKIFCRRCGKELNLLKHLPEDLTDNSEIRCPFCHQVKPFKEGYFEKKRILIIVKKDTTLDDIKEAWPAVEFAKRYTFRISFEEKEPELFPKWERDFGWWKKSRLQGKSVSEIARNELRSERKRKKWLACIRSRVDRRTESFEGKLEMPLKKIIRNAIERFEKNVRNVT